MCGILGYVDKSGGVLGGSTVSAFSAALEKQAYRGPDGTAQQRIAENALLGFNRLAIQDLTPASMQPFQYDGNWLVFNGEIYNFKELREELIGNGHAFATTGDTEVLCQGLAAEGPDFLRKLNGIFALCFYSKADETLLLARDLMGVKPLYYADLAEQLVFASDVNAILELIPARTLDWETLQTHLLLDWFTGHNSLSTFFKEIKQLERGHFRIYSATGTMLSDAPFATLNFANRFNDESDILQEFSRRTEEALMLESRTDTPAAIPLSGGIDSSTIVTLATKYLLKEQERIPLFTFYFEQMGERTDFEYASQIAEQLKAEYGDVFDLRGFNMDAELRSEDYEAATVARGGPVMDIRHISLLDLYRKIQGTGVKVSLSGQGSDELYYGYYPLDYWMSRFYRHGELNAGNLAAYYFDDLSKNRLASYRPEFNDEAKPAVTSYLSRYLAPVSGVEPQEKRVTAFFMDTILQSMMHHEDMCGMYSGVEVRVPLINPLLAAYITQCDYGVNLVSTTSGRHLFREQLKGKIDPAIINRPKYPAPKKKNYFEELIAIYEENRQEIMGSELLARVYRKEILENPRAIKEAADGYAFYGNVDDVLLELLGVFFFERQYRPALA